MTLENIVRETTKELQVAKEEKNLSVSHSNVPNLAKYEVAYAEARNAPVIVEMKESEIYNKCLEIICKLFRDLNKDFHSPSAKREIDNLTQIILDLLTTSPNYSGVTLGDLELCFAKGVRGDYGEFFGLNVKTFNDWLKAYESDENRISAIKKIRQHKQVSEGFKAKEVTNEEIINCILLDYNNLQQDNEITTFTLFYHWMWLNYEGFKPTSERAYETIDELKPRQIARLKAAMISKYANKDKIRKEIEELNNGVYSKDFLELCKIEYYKDFLRSQGQMFEHKLLKLIDK